MDEKDIKYYQNVLTFFNIKQNERIILMTTKAWYHILNLSLKNDTILFGRESAGVPEKVHKIVKNRLKYLWKITNVIKLASSVAIILAECLKQTKWI